MCCLWRGNAELSAGNEWCGRRQKVVRFSSVGMTRVLEHNTAWGGVVPLISGFAEEVGKGS